MKLVPIVFAIALIAAVMLLVAGPGARVGIWDFRFGFTLMRGAFYAGCAAAALSVVLLLVPKTRAVGAGKLVASLIIAGIAAWVPWNGVQTARSVPPIHDITTDTEKPAGIRCYYTATRRRAEPSGLRGRRDRGSTARRLPRSADA